MTRTVLISQDLSCFGQVSMELALPIIGSCGYQTSILPTALLSTHTGGFGKNTFLDLSNEMAKIASHWQDLNLSFDAIYLGYLGSGAIDFWIDNIVNFNSEGNIILLDPAMADHGKLYSGFDETYVEKMQELASNATILTPNMTEALLLLDKDPKQVKDSSLAFAKKVAKQLSKKFKIEQIIITGIALSDKIIGIVGYDHGNLWTIKRNKISRSFFGTGDMFASSLLAAYLSNHDLKLASQLAAEFIETAINHTDERQDSRLGPNYSAGLMRLVEKLSVNNEH